MTQIENSSNASDRLGDSGNVCLQRWERLIEQMKKPLGQLIVRTAKLSAIHPLKTISFVIVFSFAIAATGFFTNFSIETDNNILWSPSRSTTAKQNLWADSPELSGFPKGARQVLVVIHADGEDVLNVDGMEHVFDVMEMVTNAPEYKDLCVETSDGVDVRTCSILSPTGFWENHNRTIFKESIETDEQLRKALSRFRFANGNFVNRDLIIGDSTPGLSVQDFQVFLLQQSLEGLTASDAADREVQNAILDKAAEEFELESARSFLMAWNLPNVSPDVELSKVWELEISEQILALNRKWQENDEGFTISITTRNSSNMELIRGIVEDVPLMIAAFLIMTLFTAYSLSKFHRIESQTSLGIGAVFTIFLTVISGYGLMFCIGLPLTSLTYLFPYAMLGFGLDDTFIIMGSFQRTDSHKDVVERITETMDEIGMSITVSTFTTVLAYFVGSSSGMPGIRWFCLYASPVIIIGFIYQITFFVALIVLDDKRQKQKRLDFLFCITSSKTDLNETADETSSSEAQPGFSDKIVESYAAFLLNKYTKVFILVFFAALLGVGSWFASGIDSSLDVRDLLPVDSYVLTYLNTIDEYGGAGFRNFQIAHVYFRDVDVSDPTIQTEMTDYLNNMVALSFISSPPLTFWLRDFNLWKESNEEIGQLDFNSQVEAFLEEDDYRDLYSGDIVRDENGTITASRVLLIFDGVDPYDVKEQSEAFSAQLDVTINQNINEGSDNAHFFTASAFFYLWELWSTLPKEVMVTIVLGLLSIFTISLIFIPHPIAAFILTLNVLANFIEIIALIRLAGLHMNALTAIGLITSIGLVVDYSIHICLAYFEIEDAKTRNERVHRVITTMGKSILKGGFTTFLGVLPLSLNSTLGFRTIFVTFIGIATLVSGFNFVLSRLILGTYFR